METLRTILELIYFISAPLLLVVAFIGLQQIKEAKNQVRETKETRLISAKRESYKIAAEKCEHYTSKIIPLQDNLNDEVREKKITFFKDSKVTIDGDQIKVIPHYKNKEEWESVWNLTYSLDVFNSMDSFSIFFTSGIADEKVAFLAVGNTYCNFVKTYLPHLLDLSSNGHYSTVIELFLIWNNRIETKQLEREKEKIESQLMKSKSISIKTIGSE